MTTGRINQVVRHGVAPGGDTSNRTSSGWWGKGLGRGPTQTSLESDLQFFKKLRGRDEFRLDKCRVPQVWLVAPRKAQQTSLRHGSHQGHVLSRRRRIRALTKANGVEQVCENEPDSERRGKGMHHRGRRCMQRALAAARKTGATQGGCNACSCSRIACQRQTDRFSLLFARLWTRVSK